MNRPPIPDNHARYARQKAPNGPQTLREVFEDLPNGQRPRNTAQTRINLRPKTTLRCSTGSGKGARPLPSHRNAKQARADTGARPRTRHQPRQSNEAIHPRSNRPLPTTGNISNTPSVARNFKQVPLNSVIVTAAVGMQQQGNIQGLGIQHQLADYLSPNDLTQFENLLEERGVHHHFDPATLRDRLAIYPQDAGTQPDPDQHNPCRAVTWSSTPP